MFRCSCCDWSPDTESDFFRGLSLGKQPRKLTDFHGDLVCDVCREEIYDDNNDELIDPNEEQEDE